MEAHTCDLKLPIILGNVVARNTGLLPSRWHNSIRWNAMRNNLRYVHCMAWRDTLSTAATAQKIREARLSYRGRKTACCANDGMLFRRPVILN